MAGLMKKALEKVVSVCNPRWRSWNCKDPCEIRDGRFVEHGVGEVRFRVQSAMAEFMEQLMEL